MNLGIDSYIFPTKASLGKKYLKRYNTIDISQMPELPYESKVNWIVAASLHNIKCIRNCVKYCAKHNIGLFRVPNNIIPGFFNRWTNWWFKDDQQVLDSLESLGKYARSKKIRLTFHAPMTVVLNSVNPKVVQNSVFTLEAITKVYRWMGYEVDSFHPFGSTICVHVGGSSGGVDLFKANLNLLSSQCLNLVAVENDDKIYTVQNLVNAELGIPIIMDLHHQWIKTGKYVLPKSSLAQQVYSSWKNVIPVIHVSMPRKQFTKWAFGDMSITKTKTITYIDKLPNLDLLLSKVPLNKLRPHSKTIYAKCFKTYIKKWLDYSDVMIEAQYCSIASIKLRRWIDAK